MKLSNYKLFILGFVILNLTMCATPSKVRVKIHKPASIPLYDIRELAVVDFKGPRNSGSQASSYIEANLIETNYFNLIERKDLDRMLKEHELSLSGIVSEETAVKAGRIVGVDALIFGEVSVYSVEDEKRVQKIKKKVGTGEYETVTQRDIFGGKRKVRKEKMKTILVDDFYKIRRGTVTISFKVVEVEKGRIFAAHGDSKSKVIDSRKKNIPHKGKLLSDLCKTICYEFATKISPHYKTVIRVIEPGKDLIDIGKKYAESGLWKEATESWEQATRLMPDEPSGFYNLGVAYETNSQWERAEEVFKKAIFLKPKKLYMDAVKRVRQEKKEHENLKKQLEDI